MQKFLPWADARSDVNFDKHKMKEPWNTYFANLGTTPQSIEMQKNYSSWYHQIARQWFFELGLFSRRGYALAFDIAVQSGSMNPKVDGVVYDLIGEINTWWETVDKTGKTVQELEKEKLIKIANRRADYIDISWQDQYRDRKVTVAEGYGEVNMMIMDTDGKYNMGLEPAYIETIPNELMFTLEEDVSNVAPNLPENITPALETTSYNLTVGAKVSDNDENNVKLIVEASLSSDFTNSVIIESPFVNSGENATVTIDGLDFNTINTRVWLRLKSSDGILESNIVEHNFYYRITQPSNTQIYSVVSGDTLGDIAYRYKTTAQDLLNLNPHVEIDNIYVGQNIYVPIVEEEPINEVPYGEDVEPIPEPEPKPEPEPIPVEEPIIFDEPFEDAWKYPTSLIFVLDRTQKQISVLSNDLSDLGYFNDSFREVLQSNLSTFQFEILANSEGAKNLEVEGYVIRTDATTKKQQLFIIKEIEDVHSDALIRKVFCEHHATSTLLSTIVRPVSLYSVSLKTALEYVLNMTGYSVGEVEFVGLRDVEITNYSTALECLHQIVKDYGEMEFTVDFTGTHIKKKLVNVYKRRGKDTGKIFEYSRNITNVQKTENSNQLVTALIGVGKNIDGVPLNFMNYQAPQDDRFEKIEDAIIDWESYQRFNKEGKHIYGVYTDLEAISHIDLFEKTKKKLEELSKPSIQYSCNVITLEQLTNLDFYKVEVGDTIVVKDFEYNPPLLLNARVIEKVVSINDMSKSRIVLGDYTIAKTNDNQIRVLQQFQKAISKKEEIWDEAHKKAEEAIENANESYEVAEIAKDTAESSRYKSR